MSKNIVVSPEGFEKAVMKAFAEYGDDVFETVQGAAKSAARQSASALKGASPGEYAAGWSHKAQGNKVSTFSDTAYNRTSPQLTHLLEKPHSTGGGGSYPKPESGHDHTGIIARIEEEYTNKYMEEVLSKL